MNTDSAYERFLEVLSMIIYDEIKRTSSPNPEDPEINRNAGNIEPGDGR